MLEQGGSKSETFTGENSKFGPCKQRRIHIVIMHLEWEKRRWSQVDAYISLGKRVSAGHILGQEWQTAAGPKISYLKFMLREVVWSAGEK